MKRTDLIKKCISSAMPLVLMITSSACVNTPEKEEITEKTSLVNHMTDRELSEAEETGFMLLSHPWEAYMEPASDKFTQYQTKIVFQPGLGAIVNGDPVFNALPSEDYDGGSGAVTYMHMDNGTNGFSMEDIVYEDYEDFKAQLRSLIDEDIAAGYQQVPADEEYEAIIRLYDAVIEGTVEPAEEGEIDEYMDWYYSGQTSTDEDSFYWQMDDEAVSQIQDSIHEYHLYDEELDIDFVVHVTVPPEYDEEKAYPALVMTDAVWRFSDVTDLYAAMEEGDADPQLLITIGFDYDTDSWDNEVRGNILCDHKKEFLDFITDNLMPYLSERYEIDTDSSTLFGHSQGGVFTHYAAFNYDLYDNKPFKRYIIASPTFWTPYFTDVSDYDEYQSEYGYFERNETYDRELLITAGDQEDEDYADYYGTNDSTTQGVEHLAERLDAYGVETYEVKIYNSHHYQYVHDMLIEYICSKN